jgi:DNA-binding Lrp family transcriptional regulator
MEDVKSVAEREKKTRSGMVITDRDLEILMFIHEHQMLRIEQLEALTGRTYTRVHRRLKGLFDAGYLNRIEAPLKKDIYHLGRAALNLLLSHSLISEEEAERRSREHELRPATLDHEMLITDIHVAFELAARSGAVKLLSWQEGAAVRHTFKTGGFLSRKVTIQPDAIFQLEDTRVPSGSNRYTFYAEIDRSTMPIQQREGSRRFLDKIEKYCQLIETGRPFETNDVFRILTLTLTRERSNNLSAETEAFLVHNHLTKFRKYFLFGSLTDVSLTEPATLLDPVFHRPGDSAPYPLFPAPQRSPLQKSKQNIK